MASGKSVQMSYITGPWPKTFHNSAEGTYVNKDKDRRLAGKKRRRARKNS